MQNECTEVWKIIPDTNELYEASSEGRIRSLPIETSKTGRRRGRILKPQIGVKGYEQLRLCCGAGNRKTIRVHILIAKTFLGPKPDGLQVNHKDGNKRNNGPENLEYVSCQQNIRHCWDSGLHGTEHCRGVRNNKAKLSESDVIEIRKLSATTQQRQLAKMFNVTATTICSIQKRRMWKHI